MGFPVARTARPVSRGRGRAPRAMADARPRRGRTRLATAGERPRGGREDALGRQSDEQQDEGLGQPLAGSPGDGERGHHARQWSSKPCFLGCSTLHCWVSGRAPARGCRGGGLDMAGCNRGAPGFPLGPSGRLRHGWFRARPRRPNGTPARPLSPPRHAGDMGRLAPGGPWCLAQQRGQAMENQTSGSRAEESVPLSALCSGWGYAGNLPTSLGPSAMRPHGSSEQV